MSSLASSSSSPPPPSTTPVTILTGYLGSGKSTLINTILLQSSLKALVVENDLAANKPSSAVGVSGEEEGSVSVGVNASRGERLAEELGVGIEELIVRGPEGAGSYLQLPNGCICCTVKSDLTLSLEKSLADNPEIDHVFIECSGVTNVGSVCALFWGDRGGDFKVELDGVVCVVDMVNFRRQREAPDVGRTVREKRRSECVRFV